MQRIYAALRIEVLQLVDLDVPPMLSEDVHECVVRIFNQRFCDGDYDEFLGVG